MFNWIRNLLVFTVSFLAVFTLGPMLGVDAADAPSSPVYIVKGDLAEVKSKGAIRFLVHGELTIFPAPAIPALTAYEYRGYIMTAWARPEFAGGSTSVGIVYKRGQLGSIIQVQRIEGQFFETKERRGTRG